MGFYIRKSISAGPFRFNLSGSGIGLSVGVKGFRVGTGPRGNYVHMGRGGLYYRASLGGPGRSTRSTPPRTYPIEQPAQPAAGSVIETGNVLEMKPSNGSQIVDQINEKMRLVPFWPWPLAAAFLLAILVFSQPDGKSIGIGLFAVAAVMSAFLAFYDKQRKAVVIMYDLDDDAVGPFQKFVDEFDKFRSANRIWNVDAAERTTDWKRNAGAGHLLTRKTAQLTYTPPSVVKTNLSVPAIVGGRQNIYFFPDVVLIVESTHAGALAYDQLEVLWTSTVFIEGDGVPSDAQVVGHTWRFVNKNGGPDRRFNNNRQIPKCLYLQMGLSSSEGLRKVLHFSRVIDHTSFDAALDGLRGSIRILKLIGPASPEAPTSTSSPSQPENTFSVTENARKIEAEKAKFWEFKLTVELLRANVVPILEQSERLQRGMYTKDLGRITSPQEATNWCQARLDEASQICQQFSTLVNDRLGTSWGPPGQPGDATAIKQACEDLTDCAREVVTWKETVKFTTLPLAFSDVKLVLSTFPDSVLEQIGKISEEIARIFEQDNPSGAFNINLVVTAPEHWNEGFSAALKKAAQSMGVSFT